MGLSLPWGRFELALRALGVQVIGPNDRGDAIFMLGKARDFHIIEAGRVEEEQIHMMCRTLGVDYIEIMRHAKRLSTEPQS